MNQAEEEVWNTIQKMNKCWTCGDLSELGKLSDYFHHEMIAITATDKYRLEGKEACLKGWKGFAENTCYFDMSFDMAGQTINMGGRDMFTLIKENNKWLVVADQFSQYPSS